MGVSCGWLLRISNQVAIAMATALLWLSSPPTPPPPAISWNSEVKDIVCLSGLGKWCWLLTDQIAVFGKGSGNPQKLPLSFWISSGYRVYNTKAAIYTVSASECFGFAGVTLFKVTVSQVIPRVSTSARSASIANWGAERKKQHIFVSCIGLKIMYLFLCFSFSIKKIIFIVFSLWWLNCLAKVYTF